jgi:hypothetical protein
VLLSEHAAVTMVQALDKQSELPPSDAPLELEASQFHVESGAAIAAAASGTLESSVKGGPNGTRAVVIVDLRRRGCTRSPPSASRARARAGRRIPA